MLTWLWLLFLVAGVATIIVGARRATDADGRIPRGSEPWRAVFTGLGLFAIGQVFLIVDGAMHGHVGRSLSGAVAFLLPVATAVYVIRRNRKQPK